MVRPPANSSFTSFSNFVAPQQTSFACTMTNFPKTMEALHEQQIWEYRTQYLRNCRIVFRRSCACGGLRD
jgi:hypothetical protein